MNPPKVERHGRFLVVRDDLLPGGTKQRFLYDLALGADELVYAGPAWGGAQVAVAKVAQEMGIPATLFYTARKELLPRQVRSRSYGALLKTVRPGYLSVVRARAREYCAMTGARNLEWGLPEVEAMMARLAASLPLPNIDEVWVAAGSGTSFGD